MAAASDEGTAYEVRPIVESELEEFVRAENIGFGGDMHDDDVEQIRPLLPLDRTVACFDGDEIVGTLGDFPLQMTVPGGAYVATAGTTAVTVQATHTRRGILRSMIERHLAMAADRGEPIVALWASEAPIYGRFGFGHATDRHAVAFDTRHVTLPAGPADVTVSTLPGDRLGEVAELWQACGPAQAGWLDRTEARWASIAQDPAHRRNGGTRYRHVVARRDGAPVGFASYRQKDKWVDALPQGTIRIEWLAASDEGARRALWHHLTTIDLFPIIDAWNVAVDDPIAVDASDVRRIQRRIGDALFVRLLDLRSCFETRTYETDGSVVLDVADDLGYGAGRWRLTVRDGQGSMHPLGSEVNGDDAGVARLDVRDLGALFLGREGGPVLARADRITGDADAVRTLVRLLRTDRQPFCPEMF